MDEMLREKTRACIELQSRLDTLTDEQNSRYFISNSSRNTVLVMTLSVDNSGCLASHSQNIWSSYWGIEFWRPPSI